MSASSPKSPLRVLAFLAGLAILHGVIVNLVSAMITTLGDEFGLSGSQQGGLNSCFFGASTLALIASGPITRRVGARIMGLSTGVIAGTGALLMASAGSYPLVLAAVAVMASGMALIPTIYAAIIAGHYVESSQRAFMWTYALMAASATLATTLLGALLDWSGNYRPVFVGLGMLIWLWTGIVVSVAWRAIPPALAGGRAPGNPDIGSSADGPRPRSAWSVFSQVALYLLAVMMVCDFLCATNIIAWTPRFFEEMYGPRRVFGGSALSASSLGVCLGRVVMGFLPSGRVSDRVLLASCYLGGVLCFAAIVWLRPPFAVSLLLMLLSGAFFAAQAPAMSSLAVKRFGSLAPVAVPLYEAVGNVAGVFGPLLLGGLLDAGTQLGAALFLPPLAGVVLAVIALGWEWADRRCGPRSLSQALQYPEVSEHAL